MLTYLLAVFLKKKMLIELLRHDKVIGINDETMCKTAQENKQNKQNVSFEPMGIKW